MSSWFHSESEWASYEGAPVVVMGPPGTIPAECDDSVGHNDEACTPEACDVDGIGPGSPSVDPHI